MKWNTISVRRACIIVLLSLLQFEYIRNFWSIKFYGNPATIIRHEGDYLHIKFVIFEAHRIFTVFFLHKIFYRDLHTQCFVLQFTKELG